jgi:hypothetical protein
MTLDQQIYFDECDHCRESFQVVAAVFLKMEKA